MNDYSPMRIGEDDTFTVDFAPLLKPNETINSPVWANVVIEGSDPSPNSMIEGAASISGTTVSQMITAKTAGVPGVRYAPKCTVQTSLGRTLILPAYGDGLLDVTL